MGTIGYRIRCAREAAGITQEQLGKLCGTTKQTIFKYENNIVTNIPMNRIEMIAQHLNVTPSSLMGWSESAQTVQEALSELCPSEQDLIHKFRMLDDRGKATVINTVQHEYAALSQTAYSESSNIAFSYPLRPDCPSIDLRVASPIKLPTFDNHEDVEDKQ